MGDFDDMLDRTGDVERQSVSQSPSGAASRDFLPVLRDVAFGVAPLKDSVVESYARRNVVVDCAVYMTGDLESLIPAAGGRDAGIGTNDRIRDKDNGRVYVVQGVKPWRNAAIFEDAMWELHVQLKSK